MKSDSLDRLTAVMNTGRIPPDQLEAFFGLVQSNPFGECSWFTDDRQGAEVERTAFPREKIARRLRAHSKWNFTLSGSCRDDPRGEISMSVLRTGARLTLSLTVAHSDMKARHETFHRYIKQCLVQLPQVSCGHIHDPDCDINALYDELNLEQPPACFTVHLRWSHHFSEDCYSFFIKRSDLLSGPFHTVETLENGVVVVTNYPTPHSWMDEPSKRALVAISRHLREHDLILNGA